MRKAWIGIAFLSASWLVGMGYYRQADLAAWAVLVALGTIFMAGALSRRPSAAAAILGAILLLPAAWLLGWPQRIGPVMLAAGLLLAGLPIARDWLRRVGLPLLAAGLVLTAQSLAIAAYAAFTARTHDLPALLAKCLALAAGLLGAGAGQANAAGGPVETLLEPVTVCFLIGAALLLLLHAWFSSARQRAIEHPSSGHGARATIKVLASMGLLALLAMIVRFPRMCAPAENVLSFLAGLLGADAAIVANNLAISAGGRVHTIGATWGLLLDPATVCFLAGAAVMLALRAWDAVGARRGLWQNLGLLIRLTAAIALWLPLRAAVMIAIYAHRAMRAGAAADLTDQLLSP